MAQSPLFDTFLLDPWQLFLGMVDAAGSALAFIWGLIVGYGLTALLAVVMAGIAVILWHWARGYAKKPQPGFAAVRPGPIAMAGRGVVVAAYAVAYLVPAVAVGAVISATRDRKAGRAFRYRRIRRLLERLGPTYVKFGQIASGRRDALPAGMCDELAVLHDRVRPMRRRQASSALTRAYGPAARAHFLDIDLDPVASGSIACVYRATLPDLTPVAVKLRRPNITARMEADLAILQAAATFFERFPKAEGMPMGDLTGYICEAIHRQLDLSVEAANLELMKAYLADIDGIRVPGVVHELSRPDCLVMEFVEDLRAENVAAHGPDERAEMGRTILEAVRHMLFDRGFVHCDLHPGNLYVTTAGEVVMLDVGFAASVPDSVRDLMGEFFWRLSEGHGLRCGQIILESAAEIRPQVDPDAFMAAVAALVDAKAGPAVPNFTMMSFGNDLFDLQRDFGLYAKSDFAFPLMSLGTLEATVRMVDPQVNFQDVGRKRVASSSGNLEEALTV